MHERTLHGHGTHAAVGMPAIHRKSHACYPQEVKTPLLSLNPAAAWGVHDGNTTEAVIEVLHTCPCPQ